MLLRALRHRVERGAVSVEDVIDVARAQLMRPGSPAHRAAEGARAQLDAALVVLGRQMNGAPTPRALYAFAHAAAEAAHQIERPMRHPGQRIGDKLEDVRALAEAALWAEATRARDSDDMVHRAVTRALKERKRSRGLVRVDVSEGDPLRTMLDLPHRGRVLLPKNDVRAKMAAAATGARTSPFGDVLRKAARFSEELLRPMLGDELWELGRPVGFSDKAESRVVIEVTSSVRAHEIKLRSLELLERLRHVPGFESVQSMELVVKRSSALPVVGGSAGKGRRTTRLREE
jgi:hypothetical protein